MLLKEFILKHISIEYGCNNLLSESVLLEKHGLFDGAKDIVDRLINEVDKQLKRGEGLITCDTSIFQGLNLFFDDFYITIIPSIVNFNETRSGKGGYKSTESEFNPKTKKLNLVEMVFNLELYPNESAEYYRPLFYHEFAHAYENYCRLQLGKESIYQHNKRAKYYDNNQFTPSADSIWYIVKRIIYFLHDTEIRAYISMLRGVLENNKTLYTAAQCYNEIRKNKPYTFYLSVESWIETLKNVEDKELQEKILRYFNNNGYPKIKSYKTLCKSLDTRFFRFKQHLSKVTSKMIFDYLEDIKGKTEDWNQNIF